MSVKSIPQELRLIFGGVKPYRIDAADGVKASLAFDAIYISTKAKLTTLTDSANGNMLTICNITADTNEIEVEVKYLMISKSILQQGH